MKGNPRPAWQYLNDEELLKVRICDLGLTLEGSELAPRIKQLHHELERMDQHLKPPCYLSDEWQSPTGQAAIGVPFYLAHPRLKALEFRMMFEVEGGTPNWAMKLLRHEAAHALDHAYRLHQRRDWQEVFGSPRQAYNPYLYAADPDSRAHVRNLPDNYAQCHPEEDWAETFAVWLNPNAQWRSRYRGWPAMRKLRYVDRLMREVARMAVPRKRPRLYNEVRTMRATLKTYYERKFKLYQFGDLSFAVRDLKRIFRVSRAKSIPQPAAAFVRRHKRTLVDSIIEWTGDSGSRTQEVLTKLAKLCDTHRLALRDDEAGSLISLSTYVATLVNNRVYTHSYRRKLR